MFSYILMFNFIVSYAFFLVTCSTIAYSTGNMTSVSMVEVKSPPITTVANGRCTSAPADPLTAMGRKPSMAAAAVSMIGRRRSIVPR